MKQKIKFSDLDLSIIYNDPEHIAQVTKTGYPLEYWMLKDIAKLDLSKGLILDIGANVGNHTVFFSNHTNGIGVISFESDPDNFDVLERNVSENNLKIPVETLNLAIADFTGTARIVKGNRNGLSQIKKHGRGGIKVNTIDDLIIEPISLMKIDVQNMELEVLKGAQKTIEKYKPHVFIEHWGAHKEVLDLLPKGYEFQKLYNNAPTLHFKFIG